VESVRATARDLEVGASIIDIAGRERCEVDRDADSDNFINATYILNWAEAVCYPRDRARIAHSSALSPAQRQSERMSRHVRLATV
jgi:hypothetical protein